LGSAFWRRSQECVRPSHCRKRRRLAAGRGGIDGRSLRLVERQRERRAQNLAARLLLQVHDELLFEVEPGDLARTVETIKPLMEKAAEPALSLSVKLQVDWGSGPNWSAAH
jgi:hypothetical protein